MEKRSITITHSMEKRSITISLHMEKRSIAEDRGDHEGSYLTRRARTECDGTPHMHTIQANAHTSHMNGV